MKPSDSRSPNCPFNQVVNSSSVILSGSPWTRSVRPRGVGLACGAIGATDSHFDCKSAVASCKQTDKQKILVANSDFGMERTNDRHSRGIASSKRIEKNVSSAESDIGIE
jgi:hypothetical protein